MVENLQDEFARIDRLFKSINYKYEATLKLVNDAMKTQYKQDHEEFISSVNQDRKKEDQFNSKTKIKAPRRFYLLQEELEPILTDEEKEFIGFWKGSFKGQPRITKYCIEKRLNRALFTAYPEFYKDLGRAGRGRKL